MKQFLTALAAALFAAIASFSFSMQANAASYTGYTTLKSSVYSSTSMLKHARYGHDSDYDEDEDYADDDYNDYEDDYRPHKHYKHKHYKRCYTEYVSKYVCEYPEPRCLKQRECVWYYGKEYCRYVRKCSHTEKSCHYVKVPKRHCW